MLLFKQTNNMGFRGKPRTTLPTKVDEDLVNYFNKTEQLKDHGYSKILRLRNNTDLDELRDKAADRTEWQCLVEKLGETIQARWMILMNQLRKPRTN